MADEYRVPEELNAGDSVSWRVRLAKYPPADGWQLVYLLSKEGKTLTFAAGIDGEEYLVALTGAFTAGWPAGEYRWRAFVRRGDDRHVVTEGWLAVRPDPEQETHDPRWHSKRVLDAIEAVIEGRATGDQESYTIGGRSLARTPIADLLALRRQYLAEYYAQLRAERRRQGQPAGNRIIYRFK